MEMNKSLATIQGIFIQEKSLSVIKNTVLCAFKLVLFLLPSYLYEYICICFPGGGNGNPLQYSCLENSMDRGAWQATVHGVAKSQT